MPRSYRSPRRNAVFWTLAVGAAITVALPSVLAGPFLDLPAPPRPPRMSNGGSSGATSGVDCTTLAPAFKTCTAGVPFLASTGQLDLDLSGLVQRGAIVVQLLRAGEEIPVWECSIPAGSTESCDAELTADDGAAYSIVARVDENAIGRWGWSWTPGFA